MGGASEPIYSTVSAVIARIRSSTQFTVVFVVSVYVLLSLEIRENYAHVAIFDDVFASVSAANSTALFAALDFQPGIVIFGI